MRAPANILRSATGLPLQETTGFIRSVKNVTNFCDLSNLQNLQIYKLTLSQHTQHNPNKILKLRIFLANELSACKSGHRQNNHSTQNLMI
jgi:hypothetical protein